MSERTRIAIASPGIGLVQRGYERYFQDIFNLVKDDLDITLFKGGGPASDREKVLMFAYRNGPLPRLFPVHRLFRRTPHHTECMTFALALLRHIAAGGYDIVHTIDPPLTRVLYKLRGLLGMKFRLLYTEGCTINPKDSPPSDHIHHVSKVPYDGAIAYGIPPEKMTLLPCGIDSSKFRVGRSRAELRREYGVAEDKFVILCVAAISRDHKRVDHLVREAAGLEGDFLVWLDGSLDHGDPGILDEARELLGDRCRITHVESGKVGELYAMADVMAHPSFFESFGLSIVEAASTGLPVFTHDAPHFRWLMPSTGSHVDMSRQGVLASRLSDVMRDRTLLEPLRCPEEVIRRYDWKNLKESYLGLYGRMAGMEL